MYRTNRCSKKRTVLLQPSYEQPQREKQGGLDPPRLPVPDPRRRRPDPPVFRSPQPNHVEEGLPHLSSGLGIASIMSYIRNDLLASMDLGSSSAAVHGRSPLRRQGPGGSGPVLQRYYNPGVVFQDAARHGRDEIDLV